jgi:hypothetical protein
MTEVSRGAEEPSRRALFRAVLMIAFVTKCSSHAGDAR